MEAELTRRQALRSLGNLREEGSRSQRFRKVRLRNRQVSRSRVDGVRIQARQAPLQGKCGAESGQEVLISGG